MAREHFYITSLLKPTAKGLGQIFQLRCPDHFAHTACFPALKQSSAWLTTPSLHYLASSAQRKQLKPVAPHQGKHGEAAVALRTRHSPFQTRERSFLFWKLVHILRPQPQPRDVSHSPESEKVDIGVQVYGGQQIAHTILHRPLLARHCEHNKSAHGSAGYVTYILCDVLVASQSSSWEIAGTFSV